MSDDNKPKPIQNLDIRVDQAIRTYYVHGDINQFHSEYAENNAFHVWLLERSVDDTVVLSFDEACYTAHPEGFITLFNAILVCPAKTVVMVDHNYYGHAAWIVLCAKKIISSDFGMIQIPPVVWHDGSSTMPRAWEACRQFNVLLMKRAVERKLVTPEEFTQWDKLGKEICITPEQLRDRIPFDA